MAEIDEYREQLRRVKKDYNALMHKRSHIMGEMRDSVFQSEGRFITLSKCAIEQITSLILTLSERIGVMEKVVRDKEEQLKRERYEDDRKDRR